MTKVTRLLLVLAILALLLACGLPSLPTPEPEAWTPAQQTAQAERVQAASTAAAGQPPARKQFEADATRIVAERTAVWQDLTPGP